MLRDIVNPSGAGNFTQASNGLLLFYDESRSRSLSVTRETFTFGLDRKNINNTNWLRATSKVLTNLSGYKVIRNAVITSVAVQCETVASNCRFDIRRNDNPANLTTIPLVSQSGNIVDNLNIELLAHDFLQVHLSVLSGTVNYPLLNVELAWRE